MLNMKQYSEAALREVIEAHDNWLHPAQPLGRRASFCHADLRLRDFRGLDLSGADFSGADLYSANFRGSILEGADFSHANLQCANLRHTNLVGVNFTGAILDYCVLDDADCQKIQVDKTGAAYLLREGLEIWRLACDDREFRTIQTQLIRFCKRA